MRWTPPIAEADDTMRHTLAQLDQALVLAWFGMGSRWFLLAGRISHL
jgi:hypothetical protein